MLKVVTLQEIGDVLQEAETERRHHVEQREPLGDRPADRGREHASECSLHAGAERGNG